MPRRITPPEMQPWERCERRGGGENLDWDKDVDAGLVAARQASEARWAEHRRRQRRIILVCVLVLIGLGGYVAQRVGWVVWVDLPEQARRWVMNEPAPVAPLPAPKHELPTVFGDPLKPSENLAPIPTHDPSGPPEVEGLKKGTVLYYQQQKTVDQAFKQ